MQGSEESIVKHIKKYLQKKHSDTSFFNLNLKIPKQIKKK